MHKWEDLGMDFGQAMSRVANGGRVSRNSWGSGFIVRDGDAIRRVGSGASDSGTWTPTQADMLADDWRFGEPVNLDTAATLEVPFKGDAWPGAMLDDPRVPAVEDQALHGGPNAPVAVIVPPGGFVSVINDPHAAENRDPDAPAPSLLR